MDQPTATTPVPEPSTVVPASNEQDCLALRWMVSRYRPAAAQSPDLGD